MPDAPSIHALAVTFAKVGGENLICIMQTDGVHTNVATLDANGARNIAVQLNALADALDPPSERAERDE